MRNVAVETVENRAARALGNLAMDPQGSALVHSAGQLRNYYVCSSVSPLFLYLYNSIQFIPYLSHWNTQFENMLFFLAMSV